MASDPTRQCAHDSITAPASDRLSTCAASSELPFLVTHWLANYRELEDQGAGDRKRDEAMERLRNAASEIAAAFSSLGAYGTSIEPTFRSNGDLPTTRNATYSDMARRWQRMPPDHLEALVHAAASVTLASESGAKGIYTNLLLAAHESQPDASGGRRLADAPQQTTFAPLAMSFLQSPSLICSSSGSNALRVAKVSESGEHQLSLSVHSDYRRLGDLSAKATREYLSLREQHQKAENDIRDVQCEIARQERIKANLAKERNRSLQIDEGTWNADRLIAQHSQTLTKLEEAQRARTGELSQAKDLSQSIYLKLSIAMSRYRDPFQLQKMPSVPVPLLSCATQNHSTLLGTITRQYGDSGRRGAGLAKRTPNAVSFSLIRKAILANRLSHSMTASAHLSFPVFCLRFDRTGRYFVTGADDALVKLFYVGAAKSNASTQCTLNYGSNDRSAILVCTLRGHAGVICDIDVSSDNAFLATASDDGDCRVWGLKDGTPIAILRGHKDGANMVSWSALTPYRLVTTGCDGLARMWDIREAALNRYGVHVGKRQDYALPCSGNERRRETAETLSRSTIADVSSNILELEDAFLPPLPLPEGGDAVVRIPSVSNNAGGNVENAVGGDAVVRIPSVSNNAGGNVENAVGAQQANGDDFQIGQFVFSDNLDEGVRLVSKLQHGPPLDENLPGAATRSRRKAVRVLCIARCPRGGHFATGADDGLCRVWSEEDGEVIAKIDSQCMGATALPEQRSAERRSVRVQQQQSEGRLLAEFTGHMNSITDLHYSHVGDRILSASQKDGVARIWSWTESAVEGGGVRFENLKQMLLTMKKPDTSTFSSGAPSSRRQADGPSASCDVAVWTADDSKIVTSQCCFVKPSSAEIVEGSQYLLVWDSQNGQCLLAISAAHSSQVPVIVPHPMIPTVLCSAGIDGFAKVWDLEKGECIFMHKNNIDFGPISDSNEQRKLGGYLDGSFSPDGLSLVLTDDNGRFTLFNMAEPEDGNSHYSMSVRKSSSSDQESRIPSWMKEQYFANDYYELFYDSNGYCVERGSGRPPHLAPRAARCSFTGAPWAEDINDIFSRLVGPSPLPVQTCRRQRDAVRSSTFLWGSGYRSSSLMNSDRAIVISYFDPVRTILIDGRANSSVSPSYAPAPSGSRVDEPLVGPTQAQGIPRANRRSAPSNVRRLSSNYLWRSYDDILREEAGREDEEDSDDDDYVASASHRYADVDDLDLSDSFISDESEEEMDSPRRFRRSTSRSTRVRRRRRRRDRAISFEHRSRTQPTRVSARQLARAQADGYRESDSDSDVEEFLSTNNAPSGPYVEDYTVTGHFFRLPDSGLVMRRWLRRNENRTSHSGIKNYSPQVGDSVVYIPRAHYETVKKFPTLDAPWKHFPHGTRWPVVRCSVKDVRYRFPYEQYYRNQNEARCLSLVAILKLEVTGIPEISSDRGFPWPKASFVERQTRRSSHVFEVSMFESDFPEFIISESLFTWRLQCIESAALLDPVVAYWKPTNDLTLARNSHEDDEMEPYSGTLQRLLTNSHQEPDEHLMNSGYGTMEVSWDGGGSNSFLSPWEVTLKDKVDDTPLPPRLKDAERRAIGNALAKIETNPDVKEFFLHPVDERRYPDYPSRVEVPMDFSFIKERLAAGYYCSVESALADAKLIRINCIKYNGPNDLSESASEIYDEFENQVRNNIESNQNLRSASFEPLNDAASQVASSRATRYSQREEQRPSTRRSSTEATSLEQLPLPNARYSEGRPSRRSRQDRNEETSRVAVAPRRAARSGTASSEVLEDAWNEGDRSIRKAPIRDDDDDVNSFQSEHNQEDADASEEPSDAYSSEGKSESDSDDDVAPTRRSSVRGRQPSPQHAELRSRQPNRAPATRKHEDKSPPPLPRRLTRASASTSLREEPRTSPRRSMAQANSPESPLALHRRSSRASAVTLCREEPRTSPRRSRVHANTTEEAESPPQRRSLRASASTSHRQGRNGADATLIEETWSSPTRPSRTRPTPKSYADISHSEVDDDDDDEDEDSLEEEDRRELPQRRTGKRGASKRSSGNAFESRTSGRKCSSVLSRELGETPRSTRSDGASSFSERPADSTGDVVSLRRSRRAPPAKLMADFSRSDASDDDNAGEELQEREVRKRGSSKRPMSKTSESRQAKRFKLQHAESDEGFPQLKSWPEIPMKQITAVSNAVLERMADLDAEGVFASPVIEQVPKLRDSYLSKITNPMDFRTIKEDRVQTYQSINDLQADLVLVFRNCTVFNPKPSNLHSYAILLWEQVNDVFNNVCEELHVILPRRWKRETRSSVMI